MLTRRPPFVQEGNDRIMMQDGFSAPVDSVPRPRFSSACAMVGRHVMDFSDNGDGTLTAVRCIDRQADDLDIQFEAGACPVVAIAPRAFEGCAALRRVILPESLRQIGEMAFSGCAHLRTLLIPGGVQRVGTLAFAKCSQMERVRIEPGVAQLGPSCFSKCAALQACGNSRQRGTDRRRRVLRMQQRAEALRRGGRARAAVCPAERTGVRFPKLEGRRRAGSARRRGRAR